MFTNYFNTLFGIDGDRPPDHLFFKHLPSFLNDNPNAEYCSKGGHALYADAVKFAYGKSMISDNPVAIKAAYFQTYHTPLHTSRVSFPCSSLKFGLLHSNFSISPHLLFASLYFITSSIRLTLFHNIFYSPHSNNLFSSDFRVRSLISNYADNCILSATVTSV